MCFPVSPELLGFGQMEIFQAVSEKLPVKEEIFYITQDESRLIEKESKLHKLIQGFYERAIEATSK